MRASLFVRRNLRRRRELHRNRVHLDRPEDRLVWTQIPLLVKWMRSLQATYNHRNINVYAHERTSTHFLTQSDDILTIKASRTRHHQTSHLPILPRLKLRRTMITQRMIFFSLHVRQPHHQIILTLRVNTRKKPSSQKIQNIFPTRVTPLIVGDQGVR